MKNYCSCFNTLFVLLFITTSALAETPDSEVLSQSEIALNTEVNSPAGMVTPEKIAAPAESVVLKQAISTEVTDAPERIVPPTEVVVTSEEPKKTASLVKETTTLETATTVQANFVPDPIVFKESLDYFLPSDNRLAVRLETGETLYRSGIIKKMYAENNQKPLWTPISILSLSDALSALSEDGLNPSDYQFEAIWPYLADPNHSPISSEEAARIDILLTEAYLRALYNLNYGKVDPELLDADHNYSSVRNNKDHTSQYLSWVREGRVDEAFEWARPKIESYKHLKSALKDFQMIKADGGWPMVPGGKVIKLGTEDERISLIRRRLYETGDLPSATGPDIVDEWMEEGIKSFQKRVGLRADGAIGPQTLSKMNVSIDQRIDQIRVNLDRQRWYFPKDVTEYLLIDAAGFHAYWMKDHKVFWKAMVQVGKRTTTTPIFRDQIEHIDFNPTWSIPPGIKKRQILPSLRIDSAYLDKKGYQLLDDWGNRIDPYDIDWDDVKEIPYIVRQPPGWGNALGKVKFMFPNKHSVFLHDTNHRDYFAKTVRTTSSGCIRLDNPFDFAELLLERQEGWDRERIDQLLATNSTTRVKLKQPLPILIQYSTVSATETDVDFRADIYNRDSKMLALLNRPFQLHLPDLPERRQQAIRAGVESASKSAAKFLGPDPEIIGEPSNGYYRDDEDDGGNSMFKL